MPQRCHSSAVGAFGCRASRSHTVQPQQGQPQEEEEEEGAGTAPVPWWSLSQMTACRWSAAAWLHAQATMGRRPCTDATAAAAMPAGTQVRGAAVPAGGRGARWHAELQSTPMQLQVCTDTTAAEAEANICSVTLVNSLSPQQGAMGSTECVPRAALSAILHVVGLVAHNCRCCWTPITPACMWYGLGPRPAATPAAPDNSQPSWFAVYVVHLQCRCCQCRQARPPRPASPAPRKSPRSSRCLRCVAAAASAAAA